MNRKIVMSPREVGTTIPVKEAQRLAVGASASLVSAFGMDPDEL